MPIGPGARVGPYEVTALIGEGGMGKVWRAHHTGLKRDDALKMLPDTFATDPERLARFRREAQVLASLNHPNIAHVYGLEQADGVQALVMELVEGPTLADRIAEGPIPVDEAIAIARQIAEAFESAHEHGVVHRDLKPANVKVRSDGVVKVLDFGLAKALENPAEAGSHDQRVAEAGSHDRRMGDQRMGVPGLSHSPTMTSPALMTRAGALLGTAAYMSPEQARGRTVDKRADIWAFGCVLFEMLTGRRAFEGETITDVLAAIVKTTPDLSSLPATTPPGVRRLLARCLQKDASKRLRDIGDAHADLADLETESARLAPPALRTRTSLVLTALPWIIVVAAGAAAAMVWTQRNPDARPKPVRILQFDKGQTVGSPVISPGGDRVAYVRDGRLVVRRLDELDGREMAGTDNAASPFWSADGRSIGYFAQGSPIELRMISLDDGAQRIAATGSVNSGPFAPYGGADCGGGLIFVQFRRGLMRVTEGQRPEVFAGLDSTKDEVNWSHPTCLPDGRMLAVRVGEKSTTLTVLDGSRRISLFELDEDIWSPVFVQPDLIVFQRGRNIQRATNAGIWAVPVNPNVTATTGSPFLLLADGRSPSVSRDGLLVAVTGIRRGDRQLVWTARNGARLGAFGRPQLRFFNPAVSPDGTRVAVTTVRAQRERTTWLHYESSVRQWAADARNPSGPSWSPDGRVMAYIDEDRVMVQSAEGTDGPRVIAQHAADFYLAWAADGRSVVYERRQDNVSSLMLVSLTPPSEPRELLPDAGSPALSPDGRLLAYVRFTIDRDEVFVTTFSKPGPVWPISSGGGRHPRWNPKGGELFFTGGPVVGDDPNSRRDLFVARIGTRRPVSVETPVRLFDSTALGLEITSQAARGYDVAPDGQRLIVQTDGLEGTPALTIVDTLQALIASKR